MHTLNSTALSQEILNIRNQLKDKATKTKGQELIGKIRNASENKTPWKTDFSALKKTATEGEKELIKHFEKGLNLKDEFSRNNKIARANEMSQAIKLPTVSSKGLYPSFSSLSAFNKDLTAVSYTHLTLPTIYSV